MKKLNLILLQLLFVVSLFGQSYVDKEGNTQLWGPLQINDLQEDDFVEWYTKNEDEFETNLTKEDGKHLEGVSVKIFIGTWCGDTKYLLPKFIKSWEAMGLEESQLELIALHNSDELYKQGPTNETKDLNIHRVPTFIFEKAGKEIGRIVERTVFDLDQDIRIIYKDQPYHERYRAVTILNEKLSTLNPDSLFEYSSLKACYNSVYREVSTEYELNTYGYVLMAEGKLDYSELILKVNRYLFPYNPRAREAYGEILFMNGKLEESKLEYLEAIRLNPQDDTSISQLAMINKEMKLIQSREPRIGSRD